MEIETIHNVLQRRSENITIGIRSFAKKNEDGSAFADSVLCRRLLSAAGMKQKGCASKAKNNKFCYGYNRFFESGESKRFIHAEHVVSDIDGLHVMINGRMAETHEIQELFGEFNKEYANLFHAAVDAKGNKMFPGMEPNLPFRHECQAHLGQMLGEPVANTLTKSGEKVIAEGNIDLKYIGQIGNPGACFMIKSTGAPGRKQFSARDMMTAEVNDVVRQGDAILQSNIKRLGLQSHPDAGSMLQWSSWQKRVKTNHWNDKH
jgi:hypothetical protein